MFECDLLKREKVKPMELLILSGILLFGSLIEAAFSTLISKPQCMKTSEDDGLDDRYLKLASESYGAAEAA